jgi:hypothetical protein
MGRTGKNIQSISVRNASVLLVTEPKAIDPVQKKEGGRFIVTETLSVPCAHM